MRLVRHAALLLLTALIGVARLAGQDLILTEASEDGFRKLIQMAQNHRLGTDVTNANVGVEKTRVRVELVRSGAPNKVLWLVPKRSDQAFARYFDLTAGDGASDSDLVRVGEALDEIFTADPFVVAGFKASPGGEAIPDFVEGWTSGGWRGVVRVLERRMMAFAGLEYTEGVLVAVAIGIVATLVLLWVSVPPVESEVRRR